MATQVFNATKIKEDRLIGAGQLGDVQALNALFLRHHQSLFHSVLRVMGNHEDAEDALQDGLLSAFRNVKSFEGRSQFSTWLTRVVINAALMRRRSMASRPVMAGGELQTTTETALTERLVSKSLTPEQLLGRMEIREMFKDRIRELSPILRTVFLLRVMRECTTNETAKILSVPVNTVKARLWRARRQLAKSLSRSSFHVVNAPSIHPSRPASPPVA
ncbi:MAG TPA: sigma-70 family RNA polymerase sigma factor [Candidatus Acidoferrum sp.]|nr:sigma-70 family RNA polymerase sigma factor [Candidatus Acidoferrum sp.]